MNNRNWIAVFLGLACLVLFVSVMGAAGNWTTNNNANNGTTPQQINQTVRGLNNNTAKPGEKLPTEIDASQITSQVTGNSSANANETNNENSGLGEILMPKMQQ